MDGLASGFPGALVSADALLDREFEERLRDSGTLAFRVAYGVLRHRENAEDVAQDAFARAHAHFHRLRDRDRFRSWLVRMTWRLALDRRRGDRRRTNREQAVEEPIAGGAEEDAIARERAAHLWRAIDELPDKLRAAIVLAAIEGHDVSEVARLLRVPEGTVKSRLFLARKGLAERLQWLASDVKTTR
jgi:RNA polymerase sigma-70 factor (ECF subfamily)